jgi:hypothetical protein
MNQVDFSGHAMDRPCAEQRTPTNRQATLTRLPWLVHQPTIPIRKHHMTTRDDYVSKMKIQLDELNVKLSEIEAKASEAKADVKARYEQEMTNLREQSKLALAKFEELKTTTESSWQKTVAEMDKVRTAFVNSFSYFKTQMKS